MPWLRAGDRYCSTAVPPASKRSCPISCGASGRCGSLPSLLLGQICAAQAIALDGGGQLSGPLQATGMPALSEAQPAASASSRASAPSSGRGQALDAGGSERLVDIGYFQ